MKKKWIFLDIDNCMYNGLKPDGSFSDYKKHMRSADENWAVSLTNDLEGLREYRQEHAEKVGMDLSLLEFISLKTGQTYGIPELADHRLGQNGYQPEKFLKKDDDLVFCLKKLTRLGFKLAAITDNPAGERTLRALGIEEKIIPADLVFDSAKIGFLKNQLFFIKVLEILDTKAGQAIMFGDSKASDILPAEKAGVEACLAKNRDCLLKELSKLIYGN
ncbi:HAD family hydrolase [Patescibacteria group bacterium]|nr:HAD family hydrolase [Patescibacteria group bacterium]